MLNRLSLSRVFQLDALACLACAVPPLVLTGTTATLTGLGAGFLWWTGVILAACTVFFGWLGTRAQPPVFLSALAIFGNFGWIVASLGVLVIFADALTPLGTAIVLAQAGAVAVLMIAEASALRAAQPARA